MGGGPSKAEKAQQAEYREAQLSEFASQYTNVDMPHLELRFWGDGHGSITTNTSDLPAVLKALGDMAASLQVPLELKEKNRASKTKTIGPFSQQLFTLGKHDRNDNYIYLTALADALEPLGWKQATEGHEDPNGYTIILTFIKEGK